MIHRFPFTHASRFALRCLVIAVISAAPGVLKADQEPEQIDPAQLEFFEKEIRPLLAENCYMCHGPIKQKAGLRLDARSTMLTGGDGGPVIVPGSPEESLLLTAVQYRREDLHMPPDGKLGKKQIALLAEWIKMGAPHPLPLESEAEFIQADEEGTIDFEKAREHWALHPIRNPALPMVKEKDWPQSPIDHFILAALEERGLTPAKPADRRILIRRATFDLTGLPPTPAEIEAFVNNESPEAFAYLVDRLLATPAYGQRWGRHWLDAARYGDSNGGDNNRPYRNAYRYRNYVIDSFNWDVPYDQFVQEQLAGDLLEGHDDQASRYRRLTATGFLAMGTKLDFEEDQAKSKADRIDEQIDTVGKAFMGLTLGCARCHDHKFDPIPTADYYALSGIFGSTKSSERILASPEVIKNIKESQKSIRAASQRLSKRTEVANEEFREDQRRRAGVYLLAASEILWPDPVAISNDSSVEPKVVAEKHQVNETILKNWVTYLRAAEKGLGTIWRPWMELVQPSQEDSSAGKGLVPDHEAIAALFTDLEPTSRDELAEHYQKLFDQAGDAWRELQNSEEGGDAESLGNPTREKFRLVLYSRAGPQLLPRRRGRKGIYSEQAEADLKSLREEKEDLEKKQPKPDKAMGVEEGTIKNAKIHIRGNHLSLGKEVPRHFLQVIDGGGPAAIPDDQSGRLQFAQWLTHPDHPLTSRVMVNRIWRWHFGRGIVASTDNFGTRSDPPTHPELLNYLAYRFIHSGWSIKSLHRVIMLSATYQMGVSNDPAAAQVDLDNRYHWRAPRRRLEAEAIRDAMLMSAGTLDRTQGGAPVTVSAQNAGANEIEEVYAFCRDSKRRSVYLPVVRTTLYPMMSLFDFPAGAKPNTNRINTIVPTQALFVMNSPFVADQAQHLAKLLLDDATCDDDAARVTLAYQRTLGRSPTTNDLQYTLAFLLDYSHTVEDESDPDQRRLKAWAAMCQTLYFSNEFVYLE